MDVYCESDGYPGASPNLFDKHAKFSSRDIVKSVC